MAEINQNFQKLPGSYLFAEIARRTAAYQAANPDKKLIKMGIGDVTRPLAPSVIRALHKAADELGSAATSSGSGAVSLPVAPPTALRTPPLPLRARHRASSSENI